MANQEKQEAKNRSRRVERPGLNPMRVESSGKIRPSLAAYIKLLSPYYPSHLESTFSHHMNSIKESRERMQILQEEIEAYKKQTRDLIAKLQSA